MKSRALKLSLVAAALASAFAPSGLADTVLYSNLTPNNLMAVASRPGSGGKLEIEAADDFLLTQASSITSGSFTGVVTGGGTITALNIEIYRVFPLDSNVPASNTVPTRVNSPSDVALASRESAASTLTFSTSTISPTFTALNSVLNGINPVPGQNTGGEGPVTGTEIQFNFTLNGAINLPADHYFFIPQVQVTGGEFYWLSASRPIGGPGTTPFSPDLQSWVRNENLDPNWLRVGTDIVGGSTPPTFNGAFLLNGVVGGAASTPDTGATLVLLVGALGSLAIFRRTGQGRFSTSALADTAVAS